MLFPPRISNKYENTTYLTIFGRYEIEKNNCRGNNNNNKQQTTNKQPQQQQEQEQEEEEKEEVQAQA